MPDVARPAAVKHARDDPLRVEPLLRVRKLEGDDDLVAGQDPLSRPDPHAGGRKIEGEIADQLEVVLAHDLAGDTHGSTKRRSDRISHPPMVGETM